MIRIIFPNGHSRSYNNAYYLEGRTLYTCRDPKVRQWICTVPEDALIEAVSPDRVDGIDLNPNECIKALLKEHSVKNADGLLLKKLKNILRQFDNRSYTWKVQ